MGYRVDCYTKCFLMESLRVQCVVNDIEKGIDTKTDPQILVGLVKEGTLYLREMRRIFRQMAAATCPESVIESCRQHLRRNQQCFHSAKKKLMSEDSKINSVRYRIPAGSKDKKPINKDMPPVIVPHATLKLAIEDAKLIARCKQFLYYWGPPLDEFGTDASYQADIIDMETELELTTVLRDQIIDFTIID